MIFWKFLVILIVLYPSIVFASAWVREKGEIFFSLSSYYQYADKYFDASGDRRDIGCKFEKLEIQLYGEYGLDNVNTLTYKVPFSSLKCRNEETSGFGDLEVGLIRNLSKGKKHSFSVYGNILIPTGYSINESPRIGYGRFAVEGGFLFGFSDRWGFWDSGVGYRYYFGYPSSQLRLYGGGGINLVKGFQLLTFVDAQIGLGDGERRSIGENIFLEPEYKLVQLSLAPRIIFGKTSLIFGYQRVLYGRKTGDARSFFFNLWFNF